MKILTDLLQPFTRLCLGSLPFIEPAEALRFIRERPYIVPFWPELPLRGSGELMLARADRALSDGWTGYDRSDGAGFLALREALSDGWQPALLKIQVCGVTTHARWSSRLTGTFADRLAYAVDGVLRQVRWQSSELQELSSAPIIVFLDEPGLDPQWSAAEWELVTRAVSYLYTSLGSMDTSVGIHSCAPLSPRMFDLAADLLALDLSCRADPALRTAAQRAVAEGRILIPGILPAVDQALPLRSELAAVLESWGMRFDEGMLLSATCGHAFSTPSFLNTLYPIPGVASESHGR